MIVLSTTDLTLRFGTTSVLEKVSFSVDERDKLGIIGVNGSGKSSLFKLLTGEYEPTEGEVNCGLSVRYKDTKIQDSKIQDMR